jgi:glycosyltransferase involved in cell wall biosynthesis
MKELISIVVIGRNEESNIARCLESCLSAEWDNKEIIYCDSESTDRSAAIASRYPVRVIVHQNARRNPSIGRNIGMRAARGQYVYFIDADMVLEPAFLRRAFPMLTSSPEIACVVGYRAETRTDNFYVRLADVSYHSYERPGEVQSPSGGGGLFKRHAVLAAGGYYERFNCSEEPLLGRELRKLGYKIVLIDAVMAYHDLGVHTLKQYIWFRARQARQLANMLYLNDRFDPSAYDVAQKHVIEAVMMLAAMIILIAAKGYRLWLAGAGLALLAAGAAWKYRRIGGHPNRAQYFVDSYLVGKPLQISFQMYYLLKMILSPDHPSNRPDGQVISDAGGHEAQDSKSVGGVANAG